MAEPHRLAAVLATFLAVALLAAGCTGEDPAPLPTIASSPEVCDVYSDADLAALSGKDAADLEVQVDFGRASYSGPGGPLVTAACTVRADGFYFDADLAPADINGDDVVERAQEVIASPTAGQVTLPAAIGVGYVRPGDDDGSARSVLVAGAYTVTVEVTGAADGRDVVEDVSALTQQTVAAWKLSPDPAAPGPTAAP